MISGKDLLQQFKAASWKNPEEIENFVSAVDTPGPNEMVKLLKNNPSWKLQIEGHTDSVGGKEGNMKLSQSRAEGFRGWLVSHGIESARLTSKGFGETKPVADNATDDGRAKNRRVDLRKL